MTNYALGKLYAAPLLLFCIIPDTRSNISESCIQSIGFTEVHKILRSTDIGAPKEYNDRSGMHKCEQQKFHLERSNILPCGGVI